jgi:hypothetical protein
MAKEVLAGVAGGIVGAGLMKITIPPPPPPNITASKEILNRALAPAGLTTTVKPRTMYKFAIILFHGDGDHQAVIQLVGSTTRTIRSNEQGIELIADEEVEIRVTNEDPNVNRNRATIEILSLTWS